MSEAGYVYLLYYSSSFETSVIKLFTSLEKHEP